MSDPGAPRAGGGDRFAIALCVLLAALVVLPGLGRSSLWWDECHSVGMARAVLESSPGRILSALAHGLSPYFVLLAPVAREGASEAALRFPSVLAALALVLVVAGIGRDLGGRDLAWRAGLLAAISPFFAWHAREVRWYTLAWLLAALALRAGLRAARGAGGRSLAAATAWGIAAAMVFSPAIVLLPPTLLAALGAGRSEAGGATAVDATRSRRRLAIAAAAVVLALVAGLWLWKVLLAPSLHGGAAGLGFSNLGDLSPAAVGYTAVTMATGYTVGPGPIEWHADPPVLPSALEAVLMGGGALLVAALALRGAAVLRRFASARAAALLLVSSLLPVVALAAAAIWTGHRFAPRHAGLIATPVVLLVAAGTLPGSRRALWPTAAGGLLAALQCFSLVQLHTSPRYLREQVRDAADYVDRVGSPEDLVLVFGGIDLPWRHYDRGRVPARIVYPDVPDTWSAAAIPGLLQGHPRVVVVRGEMMRDALAVPILEAVREGSAPETTAQFPGLQVEVRRVTVPAGATP